MRPLPRIAGPHAPWAFAVLAAAALAAGCGGKEPVPPRLEPLPPGAVVLAFGDSLTAGDGALPGQDYPARLARLTGLRVINAGVPGETSAAGVRRLPRLLETHRPALVILCHGGNDLLSRLPRDALEANLRRMVALARAAGAQVVLVGVPGPRLPLRTDPVYRRVAEALGVPADLETLARLEADPAMKSDPVHLNAAGYAALAEAVERLLRRHGALRGR